MQILSCLGAEVTCQAESGYSFWGEVDETEVLTVSWLLDLPVRYVVNYYGQFMTSVLTKK